MKRLGNTTGLASLLPTDAVVSLPPMHVAAVYGRLRSPRQPSVPPSSVNLTAQQAACLDEIRSDLRLTVGRSAGRADVMDIKWADGLGILTRFIDHCEELSAVCSAAFTDEDCTHAASEAHGVVTAAAEVARRVAAAINTSDTVLPAWLGVHHRVAPLERSLSSLGALDISGLKDVSSCDRLNAYIVEQCTHPPLSPEVIRALPGQVKLALVATCLLLVIVVGYCCAFCFVGIFHVVRCHAGCFCCGCGQKLWPGCCCGLCDVVDRGPREPSEPKPLQPTLPKPSKVYVDDLRKVESAAVPGAVRLPKPSKEYVEDLRKAVQLGLV